MATTILYVLYRKQPKVVLLKKKKNDSKGRANLVPKQMPWTMGDTQ